MSITHHETLKDEQPRANPLSALTELGVRVCWVTDLGNPAVYVPDCRVMLIESRLSRAEAYAYVRAWLRNHYQLD